MRNLFITCLFILTILGLFTNTVYASDKPIELQAMIEACQDEVTLQHVDSVSSHDLFSMWVECELESITTWNEEIAKRLKRQ